MIRIDTLSTLLSQVSAVTVTVNEIKCKQQLSIDRVNNGPACLALLVSVLVAKQHWVVGELWELTWHISLSNVNKINKLLKCRQLPTPLNLRCMTKLRRCSVKFNFWVSLFISQQPHCRFESIICNCCQASFFYRIVDVKLF